MKVIISILLSLTIFFVLAWWNQSVINETADELSKHVQRVQKAIYNDDWELAKRKVEETKKVWTRHKKTWLILMDHQVIDEIDLRIYNIDQTVKTKEKSAALENVSELRFHIQDATDKERLELGNIF